MTDPDEELFEECEEEQELDFTRQRWEDIEDTEDWN